jgi:hypothetical protein
MLLIFLIYNLKDVKIKYPPPPGILNLRKISLVNPNYYIQNYYSIQDHAHNDLESLDILRNKCHTNCHTKIFTVHDPNL